MDHSGRKVGVLDLFVAEKRRPHLLPAEKDHRRILSMGRERFLLDGQLAPAGGSSLADGPARRTAVTREMTQAGEKAQP